MEECKYYSRCIFWETCPRASLNDEGTEHIDWTHTPVCFKGFGSTRVKKRTNNYKAPKFRNRYE